jgi:hypothetical protein
MPSLPQRNLLLARSLDLLELCGWPVLHRQRIRLLPVLGWSMVWHAGIVVHIMPARHVQRGCRRELERVMSLLPGRHELQPDGREQPAQLLVVSSRHVLPRGRDVLHAVSAEHVQHDQLVQLRRLPGVFRLSRRRGPGQLHVQGRIHHEHYNKSLLLSGVSARHLLDRLQLQHVHWMPGWKVRDIEHGQRELLGLHGLSGRPVQHRGPDVVPGVRCRILRADRDNNMRPVHDRNLGERECQRVHCMFCWKVLDIPREYEQRRVHPLRVRNLLDHRRGQELH